MQDKTARLAYFEAWADDAVAQATFRAAPSAGVVVERLTYSDLANAHASMAVAHGYQVQSRVEIQSGWLGDAELIARAPNLLAMCSMGAGHDVIDVAACTRAGIIVCNQTGANSRAVAEHALGLMLALSRNILRGDKAMRTASDLDRMTLMGRDIQGKTIGILGLGHIGRQTAAICKGGFGMTVLAHDPYLPDQVIVDRGAIPVSRDELFRQSDFVSVHCPRNDETFDSIGAREFGLMKPNAFFINTARGGIHREDELAEALRQGTIAGAGLDVFLQEPPHLDHPLLQMDQVIVTPHAAGVSVEALASMARHAALQWLDIFAGRRPPRIVNPEAWPFYSDRFATTFGFRPEAI